MEQFHFELLQTGQIIEGTVIQVTDTYAYVDVNYVTEATLALSDFAINPPASLKEVLQVGDTVQAKVVRVTDEEVRLSRRDIERDENWNQLEAFFNAEQPIEVTIQKAVKGGVVAVRNGIDVFIPASQVALERIEDLNTMVGKTLKTEIIEFDRRRRKVVASARKLLANSVRAEREEAFEQVFEGDMIEVEITAIVETKGARAKYGVLEAWLPMSEIDYLRIKQVSDVLTVGQKIETIVIGRDPKRLQLTVSYKATKPSPWQAAMETIHVGNIVEGKVVRIADFGAFIELVPGVDGLLHRSEVSYDSKASVTDVVHAGEVVKVKVIRIDENKKQIALSIKQLEEDPWVRAADQLQLGQIVKGTVVVAEEKYALVNVLPHVDAIIYDREFTDKEITHMREAIAEGEELEAKIIEFRPERHRLVLSVLQIARDEEAAAYNNYKEQANADKDLSLGDLLGDALDELKK